MALYFYNIFIIMKTKIIITENQFKKLKVRITEESTHFSCTAVKRIDG
jgi:hypothetical protein